MKDIGNLLMDESLRFARLRLSVREQVLEKLAEPFLNRSLPVALSNMRVVEFVLNENVTTVHLTINGQFANKRAVETVRWDGATMSIDVEFKTFSEDYGDLLPYGLTYGKEA